MDERSGSNSARRNAAAGSPAASAAARSVSAALAAPASTPDTPGRARQLLSTMASAAASAAVSAISPLRQAFVVGGTSTSPFDASIAASTLTSTTDATSVSATTSGTSNGGGGEETEAEILIAARLEYTEKGNGEGEDSDEEGEEVNDHFDPLADASTLEAMEARRDELDADDLGEEFSSSAIPGSPAGWNPPGPPENYMGYQPKFDAPPTFGTIDNPGNWSEFTFQPTYKNSKYAGHESPAGAKVVPKDAQGDRVVNGWKFFYDGWQPSEFDKETYVRGDAKMGDLKPKSRKGKLDVKVLKKHGLNTLRMKDPFFFLQLLLPIHDPNLSGVEEDGRMPYFTDARVFTNVYAATKGWGGSYGHGAFSTNVSETELVKWHAVPLLHGAREGRPGSLHKRWMKSDKEYDRHIAEAMTFSRWRAIKSVFKLNNNVGEPKRSEEGYDPCTKYDLIYKVICHNMNYLTEKAEADFGLDESTWGFSGYMGDAGGRLKNKPVGKGECCV